MNTKTLIFLLAFIISGLFSSESKAQKDPKVKGMTFEQTANYYKFWTKTMYPWQRSLVYQHWTKADVSMIMNISDFELRLKTDMASHPNYFKLYPKQLEGIIQSQSVDKKNYRTFTDFVIAGDNDTPPADGTVYLDFYKRYCYWRKLMNDKADMVFENAAEAMLKAEEAQDDVRPEKLKFMVKYSNALKILYPDNPKSDYMIKRTSGNSKVANAKIGGVDYYKEKAKIIHSSFRNLHYNKWDEATLELIESFNYPELLKRMKADKAKNPEYFKIYPSMLPSSGMGVMTQKTVNEYASFGIAGADEKPPANADAKAIIEFYEEYSFWRKKMQTSSDIVPNLRKVILDADQAHESYLYEKAIFAKRYAKLSLEMNPDNMQIEDLKTEADEVFKSTIEKLRGLFSGKYHENHLQEIVVFNKKPNWGSESEADIVETIIPGQAAYITGYFTSTNSIGIPTMVLLAKNHKYANEIERWSKGTNDYAKVPMYNQHNVNEEFETKAYFTFNVFPDVETTNYKSHVQYIPHLNFVKWMLYQPSEVLEFRVKWGRTKKMAEGFIKIDLTGDNKAKLKEYYKKLEAKRLSMVTYPKMNGCSEAKAKITNYSDLSKYGKVLKTTLSKAGDIMMPWPKDDQVDWNTAKGFAAVEKTDGKVIIIPLDFRKKPGASQWKWWSMGSFPGLYPLSYQAAEINAVKKHGGGYEILKANINKCGTWYTR